MVSELLYAGRRLKDIAGYDSRQLRWVEFRPRDGRGNLRTDDLPPWVHVDNDGMRVVENPTSFAACFRMAQEWRGADGRQAAAAWDEYMRANPGLAALPGQPVPSPAGR